MAFPQISDTTYGSEITDTTSHSINLPDAEEGDLILVLFAVDSQETLTINTAISGDNWTLEASRSGTALSSGIFYKVAEGEGYDYLTITTTSEMASYIAYTITDYYSSDPITCSTYASGTTANMNPPSVTPQNGNREYLWIVFGAMQGNTYASAAPTNFSSLVTAYGSSSFGSTCSSAIREYATVNAYDPGSFTSDAEDWITFTIIINALPYTGFGIGSFGYYNS